MPVNLPHGAGVLLLAAVYPASAWAQDDTQLADTLRVSTGEPRNVIDLDVYAFGQTDDVAGNVFRDEAFQYGAVSIQTRFGVGEHTAVVFNGVLAYIENSFDNPLPPFWDAAVTSATPNILTLDSSIGYEIRPRGGPWTVTPGFFYHHQDGFVSVGPNLDLSTEVAGGDATVFTNFNFRISFPWWAHFDGTENDRPEQYTTSLVLGWMQNWSSSVRTVFSLQMARQDGRLHNTLQYVTALDPDVVFNGNPLTAPIETLIMDNLPTSRNRIQGNIRTRYSPVLGLALGADLSGYVDDWGIEQVAIQPVIEFPIGSVRVHTWYRFQAQDGTRFFMAPEEVFTRVDPADLEEARFIGQQGGQDRFTTRFAEGTYGTQDSDLATLQTHSPGLLLNIPVAASGRVAWTARVSGYGWVRTDGLFLGGANVGVASAW